VAIYRESPPLWRRYLPYLIGIIVLFGATLLLVVLNRAASNINPPTDRIADALNVISQSVDLYGIEFAKIARGTPAAQTGAPGAIDKALVAFTDSQPDLRRLDDTSAEALLNDLNKLKAALNTPASEVDPLVADASAQVSALLKAHQAGR
jgi:hypothetical protein